MGCAAGEERVGPSLLLVGAQTGGSGDVPPGYPACRGDACNAGRVVDQHGAAAALALWAAAVEDRLDAEAVAQHAEQGVSVVGNFDGAAVDSELECVAGLCRSPGRFRLGQFWTGFRVAQLNELPQPQVRCAFGLSIAKPDPIKPSVKSSVAPSSNWALIGSDTTLMSP